jgi:hypothetical protein
MFNLYLAKISMQMPLLIKSLSSTRFLLLRDSLTVRSLPFRLQGCVEEQVHNEEEQVNQNSSIPAVGS